MCEFSALKLFCSRFAIRRLNWACSVNTGIHWKNRSLRNAGSWALYWHTMIVLSIFIDELANLDFSDRQFQPL